MHRIRLSDPPRGRRFGSHSRLRYQTDARTYARVSSVFSRVSIRRTLVGVDFSLGRSVTHAFCFSNEGQIVKKKKTIKNGAKLLCAYNYSVSLIPLRARPPAHSVNGVFVWTLRVDTTYRGMSYVVFTQVFSFF